jgi:hypothetical protein
MKYGVFIMYQFVVGFILCFGGWSVLSTGIRASEYKSQSSIAVSFIGGISSFIFFIKGFTKYSWWVPIISVILTLAIWMFVETVVIKLNSNSVFIKIRSHIAIFTGIVICSSAFGWINL